MIEIVSGDLFNSQEKYLAHQCNCITNRAAHLAKDVFEKYPYADIYTERKNPDKPGTIIVRGNGEDQRYVVALLAQYYPGKSRYPTNDLDGTEARKKYFFYSLKELSKEPNLESIAFPWKIGCGAAGGSWNFYLGIITKFAKYIHE